MQGFLLHVQKPGSEPPQRSLSSLPIDKIRSQELFPNVTLTTWGSGIGDIYISFRNKESVLILNGYISESSKLATFSTQQDACELLRSVFDAASSGEISTEILSSLYGSFSLIYMSFNKKSTVWTITDQCSSRQIWYKKSKQALHFSSHALSIARDTNNNKYVPGNLASHLLYATQIDPTQSIIPNTMALREGTISSHSLSQLETTNEWYKFKHTPDNTRPVSSWVNLASELFVNAAERLLKTTSNPLLFLSGGLDSRLAGAALIASGGNPILCTLGDTQNLEVAIAKKAAIAFGCQQNITIRDDEWYLRSISRAMFASNGVYSWIHSHFSEAYSNLQTAHGVDSAILGDLCEAFSKLCFNMPKGMKQLGTGKQFLSHFDTLPLHNYQPVNRIRTLSLLQKDFREEAEESLKSCILTRYEHACEVSEDPYIIGDYFFRWQTTACIPTFQMFNDIRSIGPERNLMFDKDLHRLLEVMPSSIRAHHNLGAKLVNKIYPPASWVPNANSLLPLLFPLPLHSLAKSIRPILGKVRRKLATNSYHTTASWPHLPLLYSNNAVWKQQIEDILINDHSQFPSEIFDHQKISLCWRDFCQGDLTLHTDIERLLGLAELNKLLSS